MRIAGWLCAAGIACVIIEMATVLPYLAEEYSRPSQNAPLPPGQFDLPGLGVMHPGLLGWVGAWGYMAAFIWMPLAVWRAIRARRSGVRLQWDDRVVLVLVVALFLAVQLLLRLTPLRYEYPLV
jgi:hypothetical protein